MKPRLICLVVLTIVWLLPHSTIANARAPRSSSAFQATYSGSLAVARHTMLAVRHSVGTASVLGKGQLDSRDKGVQRFQSGGNNCVGAEGTGTLTASNRDKVYFAYVLRSCGYGS